MDHISLARPYIGQKMWSERHKNSVPYSKGLPDSLSWMHKIIHLIKYYNREVGLLLTTATVALALLTIPAVRLTCIACFSPSSH